MMDYAARYPEAVPLKDIHAETVAKTLVNMFTRVGPEEGCFCRHARINKFGRTFVNRAKSH